MATRLHTGTWKNKCLPLIWLLLMFTGQAGATIGLNNTKQSVICKANEYPSKAGFCCDMCSPGFKLTKECLQAGQRSQCDICSPGTYLDAMNYFRNCFKCDKCNQDFAVVIKKCSHDQNTECGCEPGYYKYNIDVDTWSCERCSQCGVGERQTIPCDKNRNTVCECKDEHYRVQQRTCERCKNCTTDPECHHLCSSLILATQSSSRHPTQELILSSGLMAGIVVVAVVTGLVVGLVLYTGAKKWNKRKRALSSQSSESPDSNKTETTMPYTRKEIVIDEKMKENESSLLLQPKPVLPDCIPREIKTHEFIYFVLDVVPVNRFKELVRRLNISEQAIDRAMQDNRAFADAQYQMLMAWIDSGTRGRKTVLPRPLLQECMDRLKEMNLNSCADNIEDKYCTEVETHIHKQSHKHIHTLESHTSGSNKCSIN